MGTPVTLVTADGVPVTLVDAGGSAIAIGVAQQTHAATSKATPVDADELPLVDSSASNVLKKLTWANLKATLKAYFDTLYLGVAATAAKATQLATARTIAGNSFDGTANITIADTDLSGAAYTSWAPTVTAQGGVPFTTVGTVLTGYKRIGKSVFFDFEVTLVDIGAGTGALWVTLPFAAQARSTFYGRLSTGAMLQATVLAAGTIAVVVDYANASFLANGVTAYISGRYQAQ